MSQTYPTAGKTITTNVDGTEKTYIIGCCNCKNGTFPMPDVCNECSDLSKYEYMYAHKQEKYYNVAMA